MNPNPDPTGEHATSIDGATMRDESMRALLGVFEYFVDAEKRDEILAAIHLSTSTWRDVSDACRIPSAEIELFTPLFSTIPRL